MFPGIPRLRTLFRRWVVQEQILVTQSIGDIGFESFINHLITGKLTDVQKIRSHTDELKLDTDIPYYAVLMRQINSSASLNKNRDLIRSSIRSIFSSAECRAAIIDDQSCLMLCQNTARLEENNFLRNFRLKPESLKNGLKQILRAPTWCLASQISQAPFLNSNASCKHCLQTLEIGKFLYHEQYFRKYSQLGALTWLNIQEDEVVLMLRDLEQIKAHDKQGHFLETMKSYLECKLNFSLTAKSMFLHINTVRKRIDEANEWIQMDLDDPVTRLKLELRLQLV